MKIDSIKYYSPQRNISNRNTTFTAVKVDKRISVLNLEKFGINIETMVGYVGEKTIAPPPPNISKNLAEITKRLQIDWNTHVDKYSVIH